MKKQVPWYASLVNACNNALNAHPHDYILMDIKTLRIIAHNTDLKKVQMAGLKKVRVILLGPKLRKPFIGTSPVNRTAITSASPRAVATAQ